MSISIDALRSYVEKIAKKVLNDESSKPVISGTIKSSLPGIYEVQLVNGNETSLVRTESLYADKTFAVDDYVYLVRAENNRGDEYETKYFIVGLVTTVEQNFANLTEWERFLGDGQKITNSTFDEENIITDDKFINAVRANGVFSFSAKVSTYITEQTDFGFKFTFTFDDDTTQEELFPGTTFVGQPWSLNEVTQKKIFNLGIQNTLKSIKITKINPDNVTFNVTDVSLESGTFLDLAQDFKVTLENVNGKNYFNKSDDNGAVQIKANVNYGNQKLDTKALKYYWFVKKQDEKEVLKTEEYFKIMKEAQDALSDNNAINVGDIIDTESNTIQTDKIKELLSTELDDANKQLLLELKEVSEKKYENSFGGTDWKCLNDFNYAKIIDENGITERKDVLIYKTDDNILEITYEDANIKNWLPHYENEIKCVVGYQLANATSEPIKIYNFNHESYEVTIKFSDNTELPLLYLEETARINATLNQKLVGLTANDIYYRWYLNDETEPLSYIKETEDDNGNIKEETIYYSGSSLVIGYPEKSSKEVYRLSGEYGNFTCKVFKNDGSNEVIADAPPVLRVWSAIAADKQLKEEKHYVYWLDVANNLRFSPFEENAKIQNEIDTKYIIYKANGEIPGTVVPGIDENAFDWLNGSDPFTEDGVYYLYYSEQVRVKSTLESNPNVVYRYNDFSNPQILRYVERKTNNNGEIEVRDLLNDGKVEQLNTFNRLSNNGLSDGIYYEDAGYGKTMDTAPNSNKLATGKGYYKKVDTYEYQKVDIDKFEENKDYYIKKTNDEYEEYTGDFDKEKEYYLRQLIKTEYILREKNSENYEMSGKEPQNFLPNEEYYEQVEGGDLYINASFIRSGHLEVSDGEKTVFSADLENPAVTIGGFGVTDKAIASGLTWKTVEKQKVIDPATSTVGICSSPEISTGEHMGPFAFWAGGGNKWIDKPFRVAHSGAFWATNATISGNITATGGSIGGFHITANHLASGEAIDTDPHSVLISPGYGGNDTDGKFAFWAGDRTGATDDTRPFWVKNNGKIKATSGTIGGFHITGNYLGSGAEHGTDNVLVSPNYEGFAFWAGSCTNGSSNNDTRPFWVKTDGSIKATNGTIGDLNVSSDSVSFGNGYINRSFIYSPGMRAGTFTGTDLILEAYGPDRTGGSVQCEKLETNFLRSRQGNNLFISFGQGATTYFTLTRSFSGQTVTIYSKDSNYGTNAAPYTSKNFNYKLAIKHYIGNDTWKTIQRTATFPKGQTSMSIDFSEDLDDWAGYHEIKSFTFQSENDSNYYTNFNFDQTQEGSSFNFSGSVYPYLNNTYSLGSSGLAWSNIYTATGAISTSDKNEKKEITSLNIQKKYSTFFDNLNPSSFKFIDNTSDRTHIGFIAQEVEQALYDVGLTTKDFAGICYWDKEDGIKGYGLRYEEFISLNTFEIQKLKKRVSELESELKEIKGE